MPVDPKREPLAGQAQAPDRAFARLIGLAGLSAEMRRRSERTETAAQERVTDSRDGNSATVDPTDRRGGDAA